MRKMSPKGTRRICVWCDDIFPVVDVKKVNLINCKGTVSLCRKCVEYAREEGLLCKDC
jgi:hypothetical protein